MGQVPLDDAVDGLQAPADPPALTWGDRAVTTVTGLLLCLTAVGLYGVVHTFPLSGTGWGDWVAGLVVDKFMLAVGLLGVRLLLSMVPAPNWLARVLNCVGHHSVWTIGAVGYFIVAVVLFVLLVCPVLLLLGFLE